MPTYDYICDSCGHEFEAYESIMASPRTECPECKLPKLRRKIGPGAAILFKGSGFYQTDYRSDSYKKAAEADKSSSEPAKPAAAESKSSSDAFELVQERAGQDRPLRPRRASHDPRTLPDLFQVVRDRRDRRAAVVSLLLRSLQACRSGTMDRRCQRDPRAGRFPASTGRAG